ncbi:MAG TPA: hypothetical protein VHZ29_18595 [Rhizomicrobium sp.]|nr:hypothetical protein [Rhizomicrobium sp.]
MLRENVTAIEADIPPELFERGNVHVIDLCAIKSASGPLWSEIGGSICSRLEAILQVRLEEPSWFEKATETRYVIVTPRADGDDGAIFAFRIVCELQEALNGRCDFDQMHIEAASADGPGSIRSTRIRSEQLALLAERSQIFEGTWPHRRRRRVNVRGTKSAGRIIKRRSGLRVTHQFEPIWDARHEVVSTYLCTPSNIASADETSDEPVPLSELTAGERTMVELSCLKTGVGHLSRHLESGDRFLLGVSLSFETLCTPSGRMEFGGTCRGLPEIYRPYIMFLLTDIPLGVTQSRMADLAMIVRPFGHVVASVPSGCRNFSAYEGNGFSAIALDLAKEPIDPARMRTDLTHVGRAGRTRRLGPVILNIATPATLALAVGADFQFLHGAAIAPPAPKPRRMARLPVGALVPASAESGEIERV